MLNPRNVVPKVGAPLVYREVSFLLKRLEPRKLLAQYPMDVRFARQEHGKLVLQLRHDDVDYPVQVRQAVALVVLQPVVRVASHQDVLAGNVALDGEGPRAYHL